MLEENKDSSITTGPSGSESALKQSGATSVKNDDIYAISTQSSAEVPPMVKDGDINDTDLALSSPRDLATDVVSNICNDAVSAATEQVLSSRSEKDGRYVMPEVVPIDEERERANLSSESASEATATTTEPEKVEIDEERAGVNLSSEPSSEATAATKEPEDSSVVSTEMPYVAPSPRKAVDDVALQAADVVDIAISTAEKALSPRKSAAPPSPPSPTVQPPSQKPTTLPTESSKKASKKGRVGQGVQHETGGAERKKVSKDKKPPASGASVSPGPALPHIRRPSPPVQEKNPRQTDNPRNRKLKAGERDSPDPSTRLPAISAHPLRDPTRNASKHTRSSEEVKGDEEARKGPRRVGSQSAPIPGGGSAGDCKLPPIRYPPPLPMSNHRLISVDLCHSYK